MEGLITSSQHSRRNTRGRTSPDQSIESLYCVITPDQHNTPGTSKRPAPTTEPHSTNTNANSTEISSQTHLEKSVPSEDSSYCEQKERMRRKLQFFFMNPIEKWQARRKFPYKFVIQVKCNRVNFYYRIKINYF